MESNSKSASGGGGANRRTATRFPAALQGLLIYGDLTFRVRCTVRDISATGARIDLPLGVGVQDDCYLYLVEKKLIARARLVWRAPREKGVHFLEQWCPQKEHPEERIRALKLG
ncbi:MAG: PilZ domain-containing protein [Bauldia sp.]